MARLAFAAEVVFYPGDKKPYTHRNIAHPQGMMIVRNPSSEHIMWVAPSAVQNVVNGVASILLDAEASMGWADQFVQKGFRIYTNPFTRDRVKLAHKFIIKENA